MRLVRTTRIGVTVSGGSASLAEESKPAAGAICVIAVSGPDVTSRRISDQDPVLRRIMQNDGLLKTSYPDRVCYVSKDSVMGLVESLGDVHVVGFVVGDGNPDIEDAISSVEKKATSFEKIKADRPLLLSVCAQWFGRLKMPLLLLYLCLLLINFFCYPSIGRKYEERRRQLEATERRSRTETEVNERQKRMITEYMSLSSHDSAYSFDKIAACVPGDMKLTLISLEAGTYRIKGETSGRGLRGSPGRILPDHEDTVLQQDSRTGDQWIRNQRFAMKNKFIIIKLALLLVAAPLAIWFGALSGTVDNYLKYRSLGKTVSAASERDNHMDLSSVAGYDIVSDGSVIAAGMTSFRTVASSPTSRSVARVSRYHPTARK